MNIRWLDEKGRKTRFLEAVFVRIPKTKRRSTMEHVVLGRSSRLHRLGQSVDGIGWRRFIEGMVSNTALK
jgi:hypothetical protein